MGRIDALVLASIRLRGDHKGTAPVHRGHDGVCAKCEQGVPTEGQEALGAVADERGIYFRMKVPCRCGHDVGFVVLDPYVQPPL